jgi:hypothetical protein
LNKTELAKLFLGQTAFWHGVVPVKLFIRPDSSKSAQALPRLVSRRWAYWWNRSPRAHLVLRHFKTPILPR